MAKQSNAVTKQEAKEGTVERPMVWNGFKSRTGLPIETGTKYDEAARKLSVDGLKVEPIPVHVMKWVKHDTDHMARRTTLFRELVTQYQKEPAMLGDFFELYRNEMFMLATGEVYGNQPVTKLAKDQQKRWASFNSNYVSKLSQVVKAYVADSKGKQRVLKAFSEKSEGTFEERVKIAQGKTATATRAPRKTKKVQTPLQAEKAEEKEVQDKGDWSTEESVDQNMTKALNHVKTLSNVEHVLKHVMVILSKRKVDKEMWIEHPRAKAIHDGLQSLLSSLPGPIA